MIVFLTIIVLLISISIYLTFKPSTEDYITHRVFQPRTNPNEIVMKTDNRVWKWETNFHKIEEGEKTSFPNTKKYKRMWIPMPEQFETGFLKEYLKEIED